MRGIIGGVIAAVLFVGLTGCAMHRYQVCVAAETGELGCLSPQDRDSAETKALVINAVSGSHALAWVQKAQPQAKAQKPAKDSLGGSIDQ
jgi:hypothetical protein